jgi:hypothetical protein
VAMTVMSFPSRKHELLPISNRGEVS